jgi:glycerophosphoryl diester phosphodiesterase
MTDSPLPHWPYPFWIAHRGAGKLAPENTLAAFRLGTQHGYRMVECDVKLSADGVPFLLHDATLPRTTTGQGVAGELAWERLSQLDAGTWHSRAFAGEPLPTLAAVARYCQANGCALNIEIKPTPGQEADTGRVVALTARALWSPTLPLPLLTSFSPTAWPPRKPLHRNCRAACCSIRCGRLAGRRPQLGCCAVVCNHALWDAHTVAQVHAAGMRCISYTVNDEWAAQRLIALGTDGIITDRVDLFNPAS